MALEAHPADPPSSAPNAPALPEHRLRRSVLVSLVLATSLAISLAGAEAILRWNGQRPWVFLGINSNEPTMQEPDPELGWRVKPGSFTVPPYVPGGAEVHLTFLSDGTRRTGTTPAEPGAPTLLFIGCSFTQGWAISDQETFAWRVQEHFPATRVLNAGTAGYGTYQSLLRLERAFAQGEHPAVVVYGLIDDHEERNVAAPIWLLLTALFSKGEPVGVPYATLDGDGRLVRHPPETYPAWPLRDRLALVPWLESRWVTLRGRDRANQSRAVTEWLLREMQDLTTRQGTHLVVVLLYFSQQAADGEAHYAEFLQTHGIDFVDCTVPITPELAVPGNWHPNGVVNARWADCIIRKLERDTSIGSAR